MQKPDLTRAAWRKSSRSNAQGSCVEVGYVPGGAAVRDTKDRAGETLTFTAKQWQVFLTSLKAGR